MEQNSSGEAFKIPYDYEDQFKDALKKISDESLKKKLIAIKKLAVKRLNIENDFKREQNKLEYDYEAKYIPLYEKRRKLVSGEEKPNIEEIKPKIGEVGLKEEDLTLEEKEKGIPNFWLKCIENAHDIKDLNDKDKKILEHLKDVQIELEENGDFKLKFMFEENQYFKDTQLIKEYKHDNQYEIKTVTSTAIDWISKETNPTIELKKKKMKNKKTKAIKTVTKEVNVPSFFSNFKNFEKKKEDEKKEDEEEEENSEEEYNIEDEYDYGLLWKDEIIPFAIEYYLGIVEDEDEDDEEGDDEDEEGED
ncbi:MAG: NAP domain-containing protein [archaeon]|nr:NAP domain-containing protein [archaeon]